MGQNSPVDETKRLPRYKWTPARGQATAAILEAARRCSAAARSGGWCSRVMGVGIYSNFHPRLCGDCKSFYQGGTRYEDATGRSPGVCIAMHMYVTRTDWCHDPDEEATQEAARNEYVPKVYKDYKKREREGST